MAAPTALNLCSLLPDSCVELEDLKLLPKRDWGATIAKGWEISEAGARARWDAFVDEGLFNYKQGRDFPGKPYVSRCRLICISGKYHRTNYGPHWTIMTKIGMWSTFVLS